MLEAQPDFDPHDLKHEGAKTQRSAHVNEPYVYQEFPKVLYKSTDDGNLSTIVADSDQHDKAKAEGFGEGKPAEDAPAEQPVDATGVSGAIYGQFVITNEAGDIIARGEKFKLTASELTPSVRSVPAPSGSGTERYDGSGTGKYGAHGHWTDGDPANYDGYPVASYGTGDQPAPEETAAE